MIGGISLILVAAVCYLFLTRQVAQEKLADWGFIQSVGGIKIGTPIKTHSGWQVPILCDVSGLKTFTVKPTTLNSALVVAKVLSRFDNEKIYLRIIVSASKKNKTSECPPLDLSDLSTGAFEVFYDDPQLVQHLGKIELSHK